MPQLRVRGPGSDWEDTEASRGNPPTRTSYMPSQRLRALGELTRGGIVACDRGAVLKAQIACWPSYVRGRFHTGNAEQPEENL